MTTAERLRALAESGTRGPLSITQLNMHKYPESEFGYPQRIVGNDDGLTLVAECYDEPLLPDNARKIVTAVNLLGAVAALVEACEQPGHFADKWGCAECGLAWPCPTERALAAVREVLGS